MKREANTSIVFGDYTLLERVGTGSVAEVFRARTRRGSLEHFVAIKRLLPEFLADADVRRTLIEEAKLGGLLSHDNIAQVIDLGKSDEQQFVAMEYLDGMDLRHLVARARASQQLVPIPTACFIVQQVCLALDYAHNTFDPRTGPMHLVHRDVTPENVMVSFEGDVKLIDFGFARTRTGVTPTELGRPTSKLAYMSREQAYGLPVDRRSDIFSVGAVLFELLAGIPPFTGDRASTLEQIGLGNIPPLHLVRDAVPTELERVINKALSLTPEDRYQNAIDLHDDLGAILYTNGDFLSRRDLSGWMNRPVRSWTGESVVDAPSVRRSARRTAPSMAEAPPVSAARISAVAPYDGSDPYVFVSYASEDRGLISPFLSQLDQDGHRLWYDAGIHPGTEWPKAIEEKIKHSRILLVFLTKRSVASKWVRREIWLADKYEIPVVPVRMEPVELRDGLDLILQTVQFVELQDGFLIRVNRALRAHGLKR